MIVGVIGLGKLGLPYALLFASHRVRTLVYDVSEEVQNAIGARRSHVDEPGVQELLDEHTLELVSPGALSELADVIFIVVPTPSYADGSFDDSLIRDAITSLNPNVRNVFSMPDTHGRVVVIVSTVSPGSFSGPNGLDVLAESKGYELVYAPTLIALGTVLRDLTHPDVQIIGYKEWSALQLVRRAIRSITYAPFTLMNLESAAIAKLASNVFVTFKIDFANVVAQLCDAYGGDVDEVTRALGYNKRIGARALVAGAGFGGPCFPRDGAAFAAAGALTDAAATLGALTLTLNDMHLRYVTDRVKFYGVKTFAVLGLSYKEGSPHVIESFGDHLAKSLVVNGMREVAAHDADVVIVAQPLRDTDLTDVVKRNAHVYDLWRAHDYLVQRRPDVAYERLGRRETSSE